MQQAFLFESLQDIDVSGTGVLGRAAATEGLWMSQQGEP